jgi:calcium-dependent protein kinase
VLEAVKYCHSNNIVHRDLKPENLVFSEKGGETIKVIDFGTSQEFNPKKKMTRTEGTSYYIAPEVLSGQYTEKCDMWSIGALLYVMLVGAQPFAGDDDKQIQAKVKKGKFNKSRKSYKRLSENAKNLISSLMQTDVKQRLKAKEALAHPWLEGKDESLADQEAIKEAMNNFKTFRAEAKLQQAALSFIITQMATKEDLKEIEKTFKSLDLNRDGKLSKEELLTGYRKIKGDTAEAEVDELLAIADTDGSGSIEYSEWVVAAIDKKHLLNEKKFQQAFRMFDVHNTGKISAKELKSRLGVGKNVDRKIWD